MINKNRLPDNWKIMILGEVANEIRPGYPSGNYNTTGEGHLHFRPYNITSTGQVDICSQKFVPLKSEEYFLKKGDIVFNNTNSPELLGKTTYINKDTDWVFSNHMTRIRVGESLSPSYVAIYLHYLFYKGYFQLNCSNHVNQASISSNYLKKFLEIPLPQLVEQEHIVAKIEELFSELDAGLETLKRAQQQLKTYRQAVLKWAFEGKLTNENVNEGKLPEGWKCVKLGDVVEQPKYGTSKKCNYNSVGKAVLRIPNIGNGFIDNTDLKFAEFDKDEIQTYTLKDGDLLTIRSNGSVDLVGKCALITKKDEDYLYAGYLIRLRPLKEFVNPKFLLNALSSSNLRNQIETKAKSTSGVNNINSDELKGLIIPLSSLDEQQRIVQEIESRLSVCDRLEETINASLNQAESLRQSILKQAFEGRLVKHIAPQKTVFAPKKRYFYQVQTLGLMLERSKQKGVHHGEMTAAKYAYLIDKLYDVPTFYEYQKWHLGPYAPEIKKAINNKRFFSLRNNQIEVANRKIFEYEHPFKNQIENAVDDLIKIFSAFSGKSERSRKTELLATVCKVIEDAQTLNINVIRQSMREWEINLDNLFYPNKAEKFTEEETAKCLEFIIKHGWSKKLIKEDLQKLT